jgi:anthranilate phosphoribosyltransferase
VVEALGVRLDLPPERVGRCVDEVGIGFCYAPLLHKAMKFVMLARREIRIRTVFNILGPLTNPAHATAQVIGVYDGGLAEAMAQVLKELGTTRAFVVHGEDGLDELSTTGPSRVAELKDGQIRSYTVQPEEFGLPRARIADLQGGSAADNAEIIRRILAGERGPKRDIVVLNASAAIAAGGKAADLAQGIAAAAEALDSGAAREKLARLVEFCQS